MGLEPDLWGGRMNHRDRVSVRALIVVAGMMLVPIVVNASPAAAATIPPAFESATHADTLLNELSSLTISVPATTQNGDVLVLFIESANVEDPSGLSGWTKVDSGDAGSSYAALATTTSRRPSLLATRSPIRTSSTSRPSRS